VRLVGFTIEIYYDARSNKGQICLLHITTIRNTDKCDYTTK